LFDADFEQAGLQFEHEERFVVRWRVSGRRCWCRTGPCGACCAARCELRDRVTAFGVIGGVAGVGIAAGPIIGGFFTTQLSW
jgi:hypothetical protein